MLPTRGALGPQRPGFYLGASQIGTEGLSEDLRYLHFSTPTLQATGLWAQGHRCTKIGIPT